MSASYKSLGSRQYLSFEVPNPSALIFAFHGFSQTAIQMHDYSKLNEVATNLNTTIIYPVGKFRNWITDDGIISNLFHQPELEFFDQLCSVFDKYNSIPRFLVGFSDGASCAHYIYQRTYGSEYVGGAVIYSGLIGKNKDVYPKNLSPCLLIRNDLDRLVTDDQTQKFIAYYKEFGIPYQYLLNKYATSSEVLVGGFTNNWCIKHGHYWEPLLNSQIQIFIKGCINVRQRNML